MNEQFFKKQGFVDVVGLEPVVLKEDVRESDGYYEFKHYAVSVKGEVYTTKEMATLPQILSWVEGKADVLIYSSDAEVEVRAKAENHKSNKRRNRVEVKDTPKEDQ